MSLVLFKYLYYNYTDKNKMYNSWMFQARHYRYTSHATKRFIQYKTKKNHIYSVYMKYDRTLSFFMKPNENILFTTMKQTSWQLKCKVNLA